MEAFLPPFLGIPMSSRSKCLGRGDRTFRLVKIKHLFGPGALPTPPRWPDLGQVQSKSTVLCYHEKLQLKKLIDLQSELLISSEIQIT